MFDGKLIVGIGLISCQILSSLQLETGVNFIHTSVLKSIVFSRYKKKLYGFILNAFCYTAGRLYFLKRMFWKKYVACRKSSWNNTAYFLCFKIDIFTFVLNQYYLNKVKRKKKGIEFLRSWWNFLFSRGFEWLPKCKRDMGHKVFSIDTKFS